MKKALKQVLIFVLILTFVFSGAIPTLAKYEEEYAEPHDDGRQQMVEYSTMANVEPILFGARYEGTLTATNLISLYTIVLTEPGRLSINVSNGTFPGTWGNTINFQWLDSTQRLLRTEHHGFSGNNDFNNFMYLEAGVYYFRVAPLGSNTGTYFMTATFTAANNNQGTASSSNPRVLLSGESVRGFISHQNEYDYYSITLTEPSRLSVSVNNGTFPSYAGQVLNFQWLDVMERQLEAVNYDFWFGPYNGAMDLEAGIYYFKVTQNRNYTGTYSITTVFTAANNNSRDINDSIPPLAEAQPLPLGEWITGLISHQNEIDLYTLNLPHAGRLTLNIISEANFGVGPVNLRWNDNSGVQLRSITVSRWPSYTYTDFMDLQAGINYIMISKSGMNTGTYFLQASLQGLSSQPTYTVAFNANGGWNAPSPQSKPHDAALTLSTARPSQTGQIFQGWATSSIASSAIYQPGDIYTANADETLFAIWQPIPTYPVTYHANGGIDAPGAGTKTHGVDFALSVTHPTRAGHNFLGWSSSQSATVEEYLSGGTYTTDAALTLYAVWHATAPTYTISYNANGGTGAPPPQTKTHGTDINLSSIHPTRTGLRFIGWANFSNATEPQFFPGRFYSIEANRTLYAVWGPPLPVIITPPSITTPATLPAGTVGAAYSQQLTTTGTTPISWTHTSGTLPSGLTLSSAGVLSGTPTQSGLFSFTITATNTAGSNARAFTLSIAPATTLQQWLPPLQNNRFNDVPNAPHWQNTAVSWADRNGITTGSPAGSSTFRPGDNISRAEFITFLHRVYGSPEAPRATFRDMPSNTAFQNAISWAFVEGITTGSPAGSNTFMPNRNITREEIAAMLHRFIDNGTPAPANVLGGYADQNAISTWAGARAAVNWAAYYGIMGQGIDWIRPRDNATRAEAVTMLYRVVGIFNIPAP